MLRFARPTLTATAAEIWRRLIGIPGRATRSHDTSAAVRPRRYRRVHPPSRRASIVTASSDICRGEVGSFRQLCGWPPGGARPLMDVGPDLWTGRREPGSSTDAALSVALHGIAS